MPSDPSTPPAQELLAQFDALQARLKPLWKSIGRTDPGSLEIQEPNTVVVLPSLTVDLDLVDTPTQQGMEERMLFMLFLLRQPSIRIIYLTSEPVPAEIIDYYLDILPSVNINNARRRLMLVSPQDARPYPLAKKLLERPRLIQHIRNLIPDLNRAHLVPFLTTDFERALAVELGIPMYAADPRYYAFGTKSGCRRVFREEGVPHPLGEENLSSAADLVGAVSRMRQQKPTIQTAIVKHNDMVSGFGNARLNLNGLPDPGSPEEGPAVEARLREMQFELAQVTYDWYMNELAKKGGIIEEFVFGDEVRSPSVQLRITPLGEVQLLSTHDQMLGGPTGQIYLGARFPASTEYCSLITREAMKVGKRFACEGVIGRFAIDFLVTRSGDNPWEVYAIEVNLRKGGTTHPFLTLQYLTDGIFYPDQGVFLTPQGRPKYYVATDNLTSPAYRGFSPQEVIDIFSDHRLHYDHVQQNGVVLHLLSTVAVKGKIGMTVIGDSEAHAEVLYEQSRAVLDRHAA